MKAIAHETGVCGSVLCGSILRCFGCEYKHWKEVRSDERTVAVELFCNKYNRWGKDILRREG